MVKSTSFRTAPSKDKCNHQKSKENRLICDDSHCVDDLDKDCLTCQKCTRKVHFHCSKLPAYHIFTLQNTRNSKFHCQTCVSVPKELLELVPNRQRSQPSVQTVEELEKLKRDVVGCENIIKQHKEDEVNLKKTIDEQKESLRVLKRKLQTNPSFHTLEYVEEKFESNLEAMKVSILATITDKCNQVEQNLKENLVKSYAEAAKPRSHEIEATDENSKQTLREILKNARSEEKAEDDDRRRRAKNIIVHALPEKKDNNIDDEKWVTDLINHLHVKVNVKRITRIGKKDGERDRPLMIILQSEDEKVKLMGNLSALKGNNVYSGISVTEDLTPEQRNIFKALVNEAKKHNDTEGVDHTLRVRGSSKNGYYLKKFPKK